MGRLSSPVSTVAPVVVRPEKDSKKASETVMPGTSPSRNGRAPTLPSTTQNSTTIRKPSLERRSFL
ncbi:hypothetical protein D3C76_1862600 [compost metagenome]